MIDLRGDFNNNIFMIFCFIIILMIAIILMIVTDLMSYYSLDN